VNSEAGADVELEVEVEVEVEAEERKGSKTKADMADVGSDMLSDHFRSFRVVMHHFIYRSEA
jgi:hypothetical protein